MTVVNALHTGSIGDGAPRAERVYLRGAVLTAQDFYPSARLVIQDGRIADIVHSDEKSDVTGVIDTRGLICAGFIDAHNHAPYAAFRKWQPSKYFKSRFDWRSRTRCRVVVIPDPDQYYQDNVAAPFRELTKDPKMLSRLVLYGQVRGVIGGATTMVIDADLNPDQPLSMPGFARDPSDWPGRVWGVLDPGCVDGEVLKALTADLTANRAKLLVHAAEGVDDFSRGEFFSLQLKGLLTHNTALIHCLGLLDSDWQAVSREGASVIWSPRSNFHLYGRSIDIGQVLGAGIAVALAPDWAVTGSSTMFDELAFVRTRYGWMSDEVLLNMVTTKPAGIMGMTTLGDIRVGAEADLLVLPPPRAADRRAAVAAVVAASHEDLRLAVVAGAPVYGDRQLMERWPNEAPGESILVPCRDGGFLERLLRLGNGSTLAETTDVLSRALAAHRLSLAPLWEP